MGQDVRTGQACGRPLHRFTAIDRWRQELGGNGGIEARIDCENNTCTLKVEVRDQPQLGRRTVVRYVAPFDRTSPWDVALDAALTALVPDESTETASGGFGFGGLAGHAPDQAVVARPESLTLVFTMSSRAPYTNMDRRDVLAAAPAASRQGLKACLDDAPSLELHVNVTDAGAITQCEGRDRAEASMAACACPLLTMLTLPAPFRGTTLWGTLSWERADVVTSDVYVIDAHADAILESYQTDDGKTLYRHWVSDRSIAGWKPPADSQLAPCFKNRIKRHAIDLAGELTFDQDGRAVSAQLTPATAALLSQRESACVNAEMLKSHAPCPEAATSTAAFAVSVKFAPTKRKR